MKKIKWNVIGYLLLLVVAGIVLYHICRSSIQSTDAMVIPIEFVGEYCQGDSGWQTFDKNTRISALEGDVILKWDFKDQPDMMLSFYLNHIGVSIFVNGKIDYESGRTNELVQKEMCGSYWTSWYYEGEEPIKEVEILLHNPHYYGNANAFNQFIDSIHIGGGYTLSKHLNKENLPYRVYGCIVLIVSIVIMGTALGYFVQRIPVANMLGNMGLLSMFMGIFILIDTIDIGFVSRNIIFNTGVRQICIVFVSFQSLIILQKYMTGKREKISETLLWLVGGGEGILLLCSLLDIITIYDTAVYWAAVYVIVSVVTIIFGVFECVDNPKHKKIQIVSCMAFQASLIIEFINAYTGWWTYGMLIKAVFMLLFIIYIVKALALVINNYQDSEKAKQLAKELKNSRIILAVSQIRTHFVFNVLTAISGMCGYDPQKADDALITFSRYLRRNIDIMQEDEPELFTKSLEQIEDYIALEKLRFGDKIEFTTDLEITGFMIPPLILQPIVENAIKHGLFHKSEGGIIQLRTSVEGNNVIITVKDNGVGFDTNAAHKEGSVGLDNVRFRLEHMINGTMDIESSPGKGTTVTIMIPCRQNKGSGII